MADSMNAYTTRMQLPSRGVLYDGRMPDGWIDVNPMTAADEKLLTNQQLPQWEVLNMLIGRCVPNPPVPLKEWLSADRVFVLMAVRAISYGPEYAFDVQCSRCRQTFVHKLQLPDALSCQILTPEDSPVFSVKLPMCGKEVGLKRLTVADEDAVSASVRGRARRGITSGLGDQFTAAMVRHIVSVDGKNVDQVEAQQFYEGLIGRDAAAIRKAIRENECSIDLTISLVCPLCGAEQQEVMPFGADFFLPESTARR